MAYSNFKPTIWSAHIQHELPKFTVFEQDCDYQFEGEAKKGEKVKILGVAKPTIGDYTGANIGSPETVPDSSVYLEIEKARYFNFQVDDVDKSQAKEGLMQALMTESTKAMAEDRDTYIASLATGAGRTSTAAAITTEDGAKAAVDAAFVYLWGNGVSSKDKVTMYLTPWFYNLFKNKITALQTDNKSLIEKGVLGTYNNAYVKMTNNVYVAGGYDHIIIKTSKAIAFAGGIDMVEAYRPEGLFADAVKGLNTYGGKVVRPKEMYVIKTKQS